MRGGRQVANRAPNIGELFQSSEQLAPFTNVQGDPCSTRDPQTRADIALFTANPITNPTHAAQVQALCSALMGPQAAATFTAVAEARDTLAVDSYERVLTQLSPGAAGKLRDHINVVKKQMKGIGPAR